MQIDFSKELDVFESALMERVLRVMHFVMDEKNGFPMELNKKQCAKMLLGTDDTTTFDKRFNIHSDFPRIDLKREKYPRDAVIEWYHQNWKRTVLKVA